MSLSFRRIFFLLIVLTAARAAAQTPEKSAPNVVLITIDTLRADHVGCYGYQQIKTPNIDSLATDGARFARAFTSLPASFVRQHAINLTHRWRVLFVD
jgi:glucan phosphoethanolaminetransferase (alkaline phosphatase superfamily)